MTSIEIGGGTLVQPGWINLDSRNGHGDWARMAQDTPWPTGDNTVDAIRASHVMEHIPAGQDRIDVMNEAHRVLRPGGVFEVIVPILNNPLTWHAIADPTHVSFWVLESFHYFDGHFAANADYGIRLWNTLELEVRGGFECHWKGTPR
ncbi:methyltransferase domain-containing protein [Streptomyces bobili]|uniref:methyltransferase domain-containing protein n=1 Tax=Streptomyces bobili TaxID=67280 RepID=UPI0034375366